MIMPRLGVIRSVNGAANTIKVKDLYKLTLFDIKLDNHVHFQQMPVKGDVVLYFNYGRRVRKIVKIWQTKEDFLKRKDNFLLKEGELQIQGIYGQYIYLDNNGTIKFVDSSLLNEFELNMDGFIAKFKKFQLITYDKMNVIIDKDIIVTRGDSDNPNFSATINDDGIEIITPKSEITITPKGEVTIKAEKINLGNQNYGDIITGGPNGTFPICVVTGKPITGSSKCKAEG